MLDRTANIDPGIDALFAADRFNAAKHAALAERSGGNTRELLALAFPKCFTGKGAAKWPLKIGIDRDIKAALPEFSRKQIKRALADYCGGPTYHRAILARLGRIDLFGRYAGIVDDNAVKFATARLKQINAKHRKARQ
ncbi:MAG TPA: ProQ/FINO family protein [Xanthobacteraceae bacterium]|nr:ProQ/FINO family protein [Xanthobacteraceae bacterium]